MRWTFLLCHYEENVGPHKTSHNLPNLKRKSPIDPTIHDQHIASHALVPSRAAKFNASASLPSLPLPNASPFSNGRPKIRRPRKKNARCRRQQLASDSRFPGRISMFTGKTSPRPRRRSLSLTDSRFGPWKTNGRDDGELCGTCFFLMMDGSCARPLSEPSLNDA